MTLVCDIRSCGLELDRYGGVLIEPPRGSDPHGVRKYHVCVTCWRRLFSQLFPEDAS